MNRLETLQGLRETALVNSHQEAHPLIQQHAANRRHVSSYMELESGRYQNHDGADPSNGDLLFIWSSAAPLEEVNPTYIAEMVLSQELGGLKNHRAAELLAWYLHPNDFDPYKTVAALYSVNDKPFQNLHDQTAGIINTWLEAEPDLTPSQKTSLLLAFRSSIGKHFRSPEVVKTWFDLSLTHLRLDEASDIGSLLVTKLIDDAINHGHKDPESAASLFYRLSRVASLESVLSNPKKQARFLRWFAQLPQDKLIPQNPLYVEAPLILKSFSSRNPEAAAATLRLFTRSQQATLNHLTSNSPYLMHHMVESWFNILNRHRSVAHPDKTDVLALTNLHHDISLLIGDKSFNQVFVGFYQKHWAEVVNPLLISTSSRTFRQAYSQLQQTGSPVQIASFVEMLSRSGSRFLNGQTSGAYRTRIQELHEPRVYHW